MTDLAAQRSEIEAQLAEARRRRGAAVLAGKPMAGREIADLEAQLAGLDDAAGAAVLAEREAAERERIERRARLRGELGEFERERLAAFAEAERATRDLVEAVNKVIAASHFEAKTAHLITADSVPIPLQAGATATRLGGRIGSILATIAGHPQRLGDLVWRGHGLYGADADWSEAERAVMASHFEILMRDERNTGNGADHDSED